MDQVTEYNVAIAGKLDHWVPACGGAELPIDIDGKFYQYCFNPSLMRHAYYCITDDLILTDGLEYMLPRVLGGKV